MPASLHLLPPQAAREIRVGVVGSGYVARHFVLAFDGRQGLAVSNALTRRKPDSVRDFPRSELLTNSVAQLVDGADVVFECTGDPVYATTIVDAAFAAGKPVVTMNAEFHVTAGSWFVGKGMLSEARGDQPGSLAALNERALELEFKPLAYVNMKAFMNLDPPRSEMEYWAAKKSVALNKVISFTDGTKLQIEQALVANGLGAAIGTPGLHGLQTSDTSEAARYYGDLAKKLGRRISDYVLFPGAPHGVFIVAEHDDEQRGFLEHIKMGDGPYFVLSDHMVLVHLEAARTIRRVVHEGRILLDNSSRPTINVAAVAKRSLRPGERISKGIGSFDMRGTAVTIESEPEAVPIGLVQDAVVSRKIEPGQVVTFDDIELPETRALLCWMDLTRAVRNVFSPVRSAIGSNFSGDGKAQDAPPELVVRPPHSRQSHTRP